MDDTVQNIPAMDTVPAQVQESERMVPISEVTKTVAARYNAGLEKGRAEAMAQMQQQNPGLSEERVSQMVSQHIESRIQEGLVRQNVELFLSKMQAGVNEYPDFEQKVAALDLKKMTELIALVNSVDNAADVMYEVASHPRKAAELVRNVKDGFTHISQLEIQEISKQLKANKNAQNTSVPQEPLRQMKPSTAGGDDGKMSVAKARTLDYLRG